MKNTKDELINSAVHLFSHAGFHNTSIFDLTDSIGMKKAVIYHYFSNKDDLLKAALQKAIENGDGVFLLTIGTELGWNDKYKEIIDKISSFFENNISCAQVLEFLAQKIPGIKECREL